MLLRKIKYSISDAFTSLVSPTHSPPYFQSYGVTSNIPKETEVQLQDRMLTVLNLLSNPNELLLKKQLLDLKKKSKEDAIYDIQFNDHIEYSLREKLHSLATNDSNYKVQVHQQIAPNNFQ